MQNIIIDKPYVFVPPCHNPVWPRLIGRLLPGYLERGHGITEVTYSGVERLKASLDAGHGIMVTPNHCRPPDPMVILDLGRRIGCPFYTMGSWHLFMQGRFQAWMLRHMGVFSMYREGMDRESLKCAVDAIASARRPLIIFPEGVISRTNDRVNHLMEGTSFIARSAARQRAAATPPGRVVIHPVAIRYTFHGDLEKALVPVLEEIEQRLSWRPQSGLGMLDRIVKIGDALMSLKEIEYFGEAARGSFADRIPALIDHLLGPLETEWLKGPREGDVVTRVKNLRFAIVPDLVSGEIDEAERARRWRQLADCYLAQQLFFYPPDYFKSGVTPEKLLETVERFEEDLTDRLRVHSPIHAAVRIGEAIEVGAARERGADGDPVMRQIRDQLETMLGQMNRGAGPA